MRRCFGLFAVGLAVSLALGGCSPGDSPGSGGSSSVSSSVAVPPPPSSDGPEMDALYAEAEQVFLRSLEIRNQFEGQGNYNEFPPELGSVLADPYLTWTHALYDYGKERGLHTPEGVKPEVTTRPYPGVSREGSEIALQACQDTRLTPALDSSGQLFSEGGIFYLELYFKRVEGQLRLFYGSHSKVEKCPLS